MSLVVCKKINELIFIESDTRISDINSAKKEYLYGLLKSVILYPQLCISFAGNIFLAEKAIKELLSVKNLKLNVILETLVKYNSEPENAVEFIVCSIRKNVCRIFKISNSKIEFDPQTAWLGDKGAFSTFQRNYHELKKSGKNDEEALKKAFSFVMDCEKIQTVGDFQITVNTDTQINPSGWVFQYQSSSSVTLGRSQTIYSFSQNTEHTLTWGSSQEGSYGISHFISVTPLFQAVAIYFAYGNFGILFCPKLNFEPIVLKNICGAEFLEKLKEDYKIPMRGTMLVNNSALQIIDMRVMKRVGDELVKI